MKRGKQITDARQLFKLVREGVPICFGDFIIQENTYMTFPFRIVAEALADGLIFEAIEDDK